MNSECLQQGTLEIRFGPLFFLSWKGNEIEIETEIEFQKWSWEISIYKTNNSSYFEQEEIFSTGILCLQKPLNGLKERFRLGTMNISWNNM